MIITIPLVILMCVAFVLVFLFVKTIDDRKWLSILVSLVITPFVYFYGMYPLINIFTNYHHEKYFSAETWKDKPSLRYELSDDLIASKMLMGATKAEVKQQLGPYEWLSYNESSKAHDNNKWNYGLGIEPGAFNTKKDCIEISFINNKVNSISPYKEEIKFDKKK